MSFSYDVTTTVGQIRLLIGDTVQTSADFQDEELSAIVSITLGQLAGGTTFVFGTGTPQPTNEILLLSCAAAMDALAAKMARTANGQSIKIGDYQLTGSSQVKAIQDTAQRFRDAVNNLPAFGIIEENLSGFNELNIIRNWVLRTEF